MILFWRSTIDVKKSIERKSNLKWEAAMRGFASTSSFADVWIIFAKCLHLENVQLCIDSLQLFLYNMGRQQEDGILYNETISKPFSSSIKLCSLSQLTLIQGSLPLEPLVLSLNLLWYSIVAQKRGAKSDAPSKPHSVKLTNFTFDQVGAQVFKRIN